MNPSTKVNKKRCNEVAGSPRNGDLLYRITYWQPRAQIILKNDGGGEKWIAKSRERWAVETGLTLDQYKRALAQLRRTGLVETRQAFFGPKCITHLRLTATAVVRLGIGSGGDPHHPGSAEVHHPSAAPDYTTQVAQKCTTHIKNQKKILKQDGLTGVPTHAVDPGSFSNKDFGEDNSYKNTKSLPKPKLKGQCPSAPKLDGVNSVFELETIWVNAISETYGDFVPPFVSKEKGQMGNFIKRCPPGQASLVLDYCLRNWSGFIYAANSDAGAFNVPLKPTIDFLTKYVGVAVNFWLKGTKPKKPTQSKSPKSLVAPMQLTAKKKLPNEEKASLEEVLAIIGD